MRASTLELSRPDGDTQTVDQSSWRGSARGVTGKTSFGRSSRDGSVRKAAKRVRPRTILSTAALTAAVFAVSCGRSDQEYQQFTSRRDRIRNGMDRSDVEAILGKPIAILGEQLASVCKDSHSETAMTYQFEHANRFEKLVGRFVTRTPPPMTRVTVCLDSNH